MPEHRARGFADELVRNPGLVSSLLAAHTPDANGRCAGCSLDPSLREPWPCGPRGLAYIAQQHIDLAARSVR